MPPKTAKLKKKTSNNKTKKVKLLTKEFDILWKELWGDYFGVQYH